MLVTNMDLLNYQYLDKMNNNIGILCYEGKLCLYTRYIDNITYINNIDVDFVTYNRDGQLLDGLVDTQKNSIHREGKQWLTGLPIHIYTHTGPVLSFWGP